MSRVRELTAQLASALRESDEYAQYAKARDAACASAVTRDLIKQYHQLQIRAQAAMMAGSKDDTAMAQLQKLGEVLQMDAAAGAYLLAEYRVNSMLGDVYKTLGEALDVDLSALEA